MGARKNLTLAANRTCIGQDGAVVNEQIVVAHLRGNVQAALSLRDSLDKALLLAAQKNVLDGISNT